MTLTIALSPESEARLRAKAAAMGQSLDAFAARVLEEAAADPLAPPVDQGTVDLLRSWNAEDATDDPAEQAARQQDWEVFAASINTHRPSSRKVYS